MHKNSLDDYSTTPVPTDRTVSAVRITLVLVGIAIALPAFVMGTELGERLGLRNGVIAMILGGVILGIVAVATGIVGSRTRLSTYMIIAESFGTIGGRWVNSMLSASLLGWFGVLSMMFGQAVTQIASEPVTGVSAVEWSVVGCVIMTITTIVGFRALDLLSMLTTPLKLMLLLWTLYGSLHHYGSARLHVSAMPMTSIGTGISLVVGGLIVGVILMPDICRFARSTRAGAVSGFASYAIGFPVVLILAAVPSVVTGERDLVKLMMLLGLGIPAMLIVLLGTWTANASNLYSSSLMFATAFARVPRWALTLGAGIIGSLLGFLGISDRIIPYLLMLSIATPPIAGVYVVDFLVWPERGAANGAGGVGVRAWRPLAFVAWGLGSGVGALTAYAGWTLTTVPALDSLGVSAAIYFSGQCFQRRARRLRAAG